ncbi:uncharacterized protein LOC129909206 [Episyrphus balteatus]|uniref:uncharacterized protein LOC129909206 n=1 Tax=Episyrphus balteatus TaxID=286459 RepID=UPI002486B0FB|nr:uncharacterized protein LOC129909206 [Episyrphus balteatus]
MFKITIIALFAILASASAKPGVIAPLAYSAPLIAGPGIVTATSNQVIARNYNGIAAAPLLAAAPIAAPLLASAPIAAPLTAAPFGFPSAAYSAPLRYAAAYNYATAPFAPLGSLSYAAPAQYII